MDKPIVYNQTRRMLYASSLIAIICFLLLFVQAHTASGNDTVAEITPQGLQFKTEVNVSIETEELFISLEKIQVAYVFKNHSDKDITAVMAFPIPPYSASAAATTPFSHYPLNFDDFEIEVNGHKISHEKEVRAILEKDGKTDITDILKDMNISIEYFGGFDGRRPLKRAATRELNEEDEETLLRIGAIDPRYKWPKWKVVMMYYWTQTFPANSSINVRHSYAPYYGARHQVFQKWKNEMLGEIDEDIAKESCLNQKTKKNIEKKAIKKVKKTEKMVQVDYSWVSYILTTANNWKKPIREFHLILEKPKNTILSLCFDHKLIRTSATRFEARVENFIPTKDLKIFFISKEGKI